MDIFRSFVTTNGSKCVVCVAFHASPIRRSGSAERLTRDESRSRSTSPLRDVADDDDDDEDEDDEDDDAISSLSGVDIDPVSVQLTLRNFSKQLVTAKKDRVSNDLLTYGLVVLLRR